MERIAEAICPEKCGLAIEIGPGRGSLTDHLLRRAERVIAIEIDPVLVEYLRAKYRNETRLTIVESDVLKADLAQWGPAVIAGNLPYYITSPIVEQVLRLGTLASHAVFLVQKEVAERMTSGPGSRDYGYLSVLTQFYTQAELLFTIPPEAFRPPPKVDSAVVRLTPFTRSVPENAKGFLGFASQCFRQKRKTLKNNLQGSFRKEDLANLPETAKRAEQMSIPELMDLFHKLRAAANSARSELLEPTDSPQSDLS